MIIDEIKARLGDDYEVMSVNKRKNNGVLLNGVGIRRKGEPSGSVIYYADDDTNAVERVLATYKETAKRLPKITAADVTHEKILEKAFPVLINRELNTDQLDGIMHEPWNDLEIIYRMDFGVGSAIITKQMAAESNITLEDLHDTHNREFMVLRLTDYMTAHTGIQHPDTPFHLVTNMDMCHGSGAILNPEAIEALQDALGENFIIIPSSVHELLALPDAGDTSEILEIVKMTNATMVSEEDFLSNSVYRYNGSSNTWEVIA